MNHPQRKDEQIISYQQLRAFIGLTGILLPVMVVLGCWIKGDGSNSLQESISHYYYSNMHIIFVGVLCVLGGFLITYRGTDALESRVSNIAGTCAFGIAAWPTTVSDFRQVGGPEQYVSLLNPVTDGWGKVHFIVAGGLFFCFTLFCLKFFQKPDQQYTGHDLVKFQRRRKIYTACGIAIIGSCCLIALFAFVVKPASGPFVYSTFIFETTALWAFGIAWLVKGSAVLQKVPVARNIIQSIR